MNGADVRDHCLIAGQFRGAAHNSYDLKLILDKTKITIPLFFHNFRGYYLHILMQATSKINGRLTCVPNKAEKYFFVTWETSIN